MKAWRRAQRPVCPAEVPTDNDLIYWVIFM
jgi:hypothetical protein